MAELSTELELRVGVGARVPVALRNVFDGAVRLVVTNLCAAEPGCGAALWLLFGFFFFFHKRALSLLGMARCSAPCRRPPELTLDCRVAGGEVTAIPCLGSV